VLVSFDCIRSISWLAVGCYPTHTPHSYGPSLAPESEAETTSLAPTDTPHYYEPSLAPTSESANNCWERRYYMHSCSEAADTGATVMYIMFVTSLVAGIVACIALVSLRHRVCFLCR
jgi:hypothetical protein